MVARHGSSAGRDSSGNRAISVSVALFAIYAWYYVTRKTLTYAAPMLGFDKPTLGLCASVFNTLYGLAKLVTGAMSDRISPSLMLCGGLAVCGLINVVMAFSSSRMAFVALWGMNGWFQGCGWPACSQILRNWWEPTRRARVFSLVYASVNAGTMLAPFVVAAAADSSFSPFSSESPLPSIENADQNNVSTGDWHAAFALPGTIGIVLAAVMLLVVRDSPSSGRQAAPAEDAGSPREIGNPIGEPRRSVWSALMSRGVLAILICNALTYVPRTALSDWSVLYLQETHGLTPTMTASVWLWFEVGGVLGTVVAGAISDQLFGGARGPVVVLFSASCAVGCIAYHFSTDGLALVVSTAALGFVTYAPTLMVNLFALEAAPVASTGLVSGIANFCGQGGAALAGLPLGLVLDAWGWKGLFASGAVASLIVVALTIPLWTFRGPGASSSKVRQQSPPAVKPRLQPGSAGEP